MTLHKFKSFKHAELLFSKGFTCVVGPNGSGKSNICDALLFGLGEGSLRRLRANRLESLITAPASKSSELRKAYIRIQLGGDEEMEVTRAVRSDGKSLYRLNGKRFSRQEVLEVISKHGIHADETNTITQGEINRLIDLNPKGRRELIDIASGIEEFERKKEESLKELEKVSQRINEAQVMLDERLGFLKELEAEKQVAEKYLQMGARLRLLNYSIITAKKEDSATMLSDYTKGMAIIDSRENELAYKIEGLAKRMGELNLERQQLTKELGESAKTMGSISAKLDAAKMEIAKLEMSSANSLNLITENEKTIKTLQEEEASTRETIKRNLEQVETLAVKISEMEEKLGKNEINTKGISADVGNVDQLSATVKEIEVSSEELNNRIMGIRSEISNLGSGKDSVLKNAGAIQGSIKELLEKKSETGKRQKESSSKTGMLNSAGKALISEIQALEKEIGSTEGRILDLKMQKASSQPRSGAVYDRIKEKFGKDSGFYGKASELCNYSLGNAPAVEAAAGGRFDYIVVDNMETANSIIRHIKENNLGRATFIPIKELLPSSENQKEKEAKPLIEIVEFENKFKKAFEFVFNNTYLVEDSSQAKKLGIGKHRYVTVSGEAIEQSGVISGGSMQKRTSVAHIEKEIRELTDKSIELKKDHTEKTEKLAKNRKEMAYAEMDAKTADKDIAGIEDEIKRREEERLSISKEIKKIEEREEIMAKELSKREDEKQKQIEQLEEARKKLSNAYNKTVELSKSLAKYGLGKEDLARLEAMRKEAENLRINKASTQKENQMLEEKSAGLKKQMSEKRKAIDNDKKTIKENEKKRSEFEKARKETEEKITSDNEVSKKIYGKINAIETELAKTTTEHSRISVEHANMDRQLAELKMKRSQAETRINDLTAELAVYKEESAPLKEEITGMEKEAIVLNAKITELGNVNLKAPEAFIEKKKNADEALTKVATLDTERQAILRMIQEIESKKLQTFMSTLNEIAKNFTKLYNYIFTGNAAIMLENPKDPFNSGLEVKVTNEGRTKVLSSMSGGEKSLLSLILIFAIHMCKPSGLYIFDEVDAALDKENSKKLSHLIKEMSKNAQFIVVSHNDSLIVNADTAIGVAKTNEESKAVGIEISSIVSRKK